MTINIRKFNSSEDLENVLNLFYGYSKINRKRKSGFRRRLLLSSVLGAPFSWLGEDTFIGSIAEKDDEHIVGTVLARRFPFGKSWVIGPVVLAPGSRGSGIATHMMNFTVEQLRRRKAKFAILSVGTGNIEARRFFEKSGFKYFGPALMDHFEARKHVQMFTLISGYLRNIVYNIGQYPLRTEIFNSNKERRTNKIRTWHLMLRKL